VIVATDDDPDTEDRMKILEQLVKDIPRAQEQ